jgi:hypothetical protein
MEINTEGVDWEAIDDALLRICFEEDADLS